MRAATISIPERREMVARLRAVLEPEVESYTIYEDVEHRGHYWNLRRCMTEMLATAPAGEPVLITCDDAITVPGWRRYWERMHAAANNTIYVLSVGYRYPFTPDNVARGYVTKRYARCYYDHAVILVNQPDLPGRVDRWLLEPAQADLFKHYRCPWYDVAIQAYLVATGVVWTIATPTLFDHVGIGTLSSLGHIIRGSPDYIGKRPNWQELIRRERFG